MKKVERDTYFFLFTIREINNDSIIFSKNPVFYYKNRKFIEDTWYYNGFCLDIIMKEIKWELTKVIYPIVEGAYNVLSRL